MKREKRIQKYRTIMVILYLCKEFFLDKNELVEKCKDQVSDYQKKYKAFYVTFSIE